MRISSVVRKWSAGVALLALLASGVGIAAVMIFGSGGASNQASRATTPRTTLAPRLPASNQASRATTPRTTLAPRLPKVPTPFEFTVNVVVTDRQCAPESPTCTYKYTIEPKYIGLHPLPQTPVTVFYEVIGGNTPQKGEFTVHNDQARILKDVVLEGSPASQLKANVLQVAG
ncbi:hypothetical protein DQP55_25015 [Mycolicibacterium sp. GF69]|uniref:hypothetical protein n=1 Tax=Mycolicibacterium sp. GF69 TaxID=2267251 RepID=UPI000DCDBF7B|nr:hypothetical protein [Mycolicibacterium sp. GF69]RAV05860.1 hypothetical protein DQP55_25015 [Mycolicibacterium sp. GF69]